jgi:hypothetical protein
MHDQRYAPDTCPLHWLAACSVPGVRGAPQARVYYYEAYAQRLASWGFAVVQYDVPLFSIVKDGAEVLHRAHDPVWGLQQSFCLFWDEESSPLT